MRPQLVAGRYQVLRAIGRGGMGTVWLCRDQVLGREVAVKQIGALTGDSATETRRAMREARSAAALNHPNAVAVYDVVDHEGRPWLVMEYVDGQTLAEEISRDGRLSPQRVADIGAQLAAALARAHERRIVHRDIKPGNVLIDKNGRPKISDFGIARGHEDEALTQVGFVTGTPGFLSPELARGADPSSASDVWALGATLYSAVEGQSPYAPRSNPIALLQAVATERPRPMTYAGALRPAIEAMMDEDPARRWDMATIAKRLIPIARRDATLVMPLAYPYSVAPTPRREPTATMAVLDPEGTAAMAALDPEGTAAMAAVDPDGTAAMAAVDPDGTAAMAAVDPDGTAAMAAPPARSIKPPQEARRPKQTQQPTGTQRPVATPRPLATPRPESVQPQLATPRPAATQQPVATQPTQPTHGTQAADRGKGRRLAPIAAAAVIVAMLGVAFAVNQFGDQAGTGQVLGKPTVTAPATTTAPGGSTTTPPPSTTGAADQNADKNLESFVKSYYSEVTKDTDHTWALLSPTMQRTAQGRDSYDGFWKTIDKVKVNSTLPNAAAGEAVVNLTFTRDDGTTSTETHRFTFVKDGAGYLIESDKNIS